MAAGLPEAGRCWPEVGSAAPAQAVSNRGPQGRKNDFLDAERLVKRWVAQELKLSFVPDAEQRLWRTVKRKKVQLTRLRAGLQNQLEALLEEAHIKLSSFVSDRLGASARRMLQALAEGETNPEALAGLADKRLRATPEQLRDALGACTELNSVYRRLLNYRLVTRGQVWIDRGTVAFEQRRQQRDLASLQRKARSLGMQLVPAA
jgi:transposase